MVCVPPMFTASVPVPVALAGRRQQRRQVDDGANSSDGAGHVLLICDVARDDLHSIVALQAREVHGREVEDPDGAVGTQEPLHQPPPHTSRAPGDEDRTGHVRVVPFIPAFSIRLWALLMNCSNAGSKLVQSPAFRNSTREAASRWQARAAGTLGMVLKKKVPLISPNLSTISVTGGLPGLILRAEAVGDLPAGRHALVKELLS